MKRGLLVMIVVVLGVGSTVIAQAESAGPSKVTFNADEVMEINGQKVFFISFSKGPPPDGKTPDGKDAYAELADAGATFLRTGVLAEGKKWDEAGLAEEIKTLDAAAKHGLHCMPSLKELSSIKEGDEKTEAMMRKVIGAIKDHPAMGAYKGVDEPAWGKHPIPPMLNAYKLIKQIDPNHPIWVAQAPRDTIEIMKTYDRAYDCTGLDIYPIAYPPGGHSPLPNKNISMVGDWTKWMMTVAGGKKPVWMVLQIAWSGVARQEKEVTDKKGKTRIQEGATLRFPTFPEERYMTYETIINGARGVQYFGGSLPMTLNDRDKPLEWNWTFWQKVLRPVIEEIGTKSPLYSALVAPNSKLPVKVKATGKAAALAANEVEYCVREVGDELFIIASKREGNTVEVEFSGLPVSASSGDVMFEEPRKVDVEKGTFTDWFGPFEVHVYRMKK